MVIKWLTKLKLMRKDTDEGYAHVSDIKTPLIKVKGIGISTVAKFKMMDIETVEKLKGYGFNDLKNMYADIFTDTQIKKFMALVKGH